MPLRLLKMLCSVVVGVVLVGSCGRPGFGQNVVWYDDFNDGSYGRNTDGFFLNRCDGTVSTLDASSGDLVADGTTAEWSMWCLNEHDRIALPRLSELSFRIDATVDTGFIAVGKTSFDHAGLWITDTRWLDQLWPGQVFESGVGRDVINTEVPYPVAGERVTLQVDVFDGSIVSHLWRDGDPDSLIELEYFAPLAKSQRPSFVVQGHYTVHQMWVSTSPLPLTFAAGDFNFDSQLSVADIDQLTTASQQQFDSRYDLNADGQLDHLDRDMWVHSLKNTWYGDANLDGEFSTPDFVEVFAAGKYETESSAGWSEGDWNGDMSFSSSDLVVALAEGAFEQGPREAVTIPVPEPSTIMLLLIASVVSSRFWRRPR